MKSLLSGFFALLAFQIFFTSSSFAQLNYSEFSTNSTANFSFLGDSGISGNTLRLIGMPEGNGFRGAVWHNQTHRVSDGFVAMFTFRIVDAKGPKGGGDGFAFVIQNQGTNTIGYGGSSIGYANDSGNLGTANHRESEPSIVNKMFHPLTNFIGEGVCQMNSWEGFSSIHLNETTQTLTGSSTTMIYTLNKSPQSCSVSATMTGPNVSVSDSNSDCNNNPSVLLTSTNYLPGSTYCVSGTHSFQGTCTTRTCLTTPGKGTAGIPYSLAFEFDTFRNVELGDPDGNHLSIHTRQDEPNEADEKASLAITSNIPLLKDGNPHTVRIEYDGPSNNNQMRVYVDDLATPKLTLSVELTEILRDGGQSAFIGFTAGSSEDETETNEILNWSFSPKFTQISYAGTAPDADQMGPYQVSTVDYHPGADASDFNPNAGIDTAVLPDRKTEHWAKYYFPDNLSGGPYPLVILLHGNHNSCGVGTNPRVDNNNQYAETGACPSGYVVAPSHRGYDYLAEKLSSYGYIVASVNANLGVHSVLGYPLSSFTDSGKFPEYTDDLNLILARGRLVLRHLQRLSEWNEGVSTFATSTSIAPSRPTGETGWFGMKIEVGSEPVTVRALGRMYQHGNSGTHPIRIVKASDNAVVAEASVTMTNWNHGQYKYAELSSPVTLAANTIYYVASQEFSGGDRWSRATITSSNVARIMGGIRSYNGFTWRNIGGNPYPFVPVDFIYEKDSSTPPQLGLNLKGKIDFDNVGLMGHSRGGEGMRAAYELYRETNSPWQSRIRNSMSLITLKGIFEFAPTDRYVQDRHRNLLRLLNADGTAWSSLLPACDGDVFNLQGVKPLDRMLKLTNENPAKPKSTIYVYGANHNFYNTQWQISDSFRSDIAPLDPNGCTGVANDPLFLNPTITGTGYGTLAQQKTGLSSFLAFMLGNVGNSANKYFNQNFDPRYDVPSNLSSITKTERSYTPSPNSNQTLILNDLDFPVTTNLCVSSTVVCSSSDLQAVSTKVQVRTDPMFAGFMNHDEDFNAAHISWTSPSPGRYFQANSAATSINVEMHETLDFRISRRRDSSNRLQIDALNDADFTNFSIQLVMADDTISGAVGLSKYIQLVGPIGKTDQIYTPPLGTLPIGELHPILRTARIPLSDFNSADLTQVRGIRFIFNHTLRGSINLGNIRFLRQ